MNKSRGIGRFMKGDLYWIVKHYDQRFKDIEERERLAKENVDSLMNGFPEKYVKKGDASKIETKVEDLTTFKEQMTGKASQRALVITLVISIFSLLIAGTVAIAGLLRHFQY